MSIWVLITIVFQFLTLAGVVIVWVRTTRIQNHEDQRLSKGLQLLQGKLAALEDLSDRTEVQVKQLVAIIEMKIRDIQNKIGEADQMVRQIENSIQKSMDVANIFQDKIPHEEVLERQYTKKYVQAAQLAHQGQTIDQIVSQVDLGRAEVELIMKLNKDNLQFDVSSLPAWAKADASSSNTRQPARESTLSIPTAFESKLNEVREINMENAFDIPQPQTDSLKKLGEQFKSAIQTNPKLPHETKINESAENSLLNTFSQFFDSMTDKGRPVANKASLEKKSETIVQGGKRMVVKPYEFKKIDQAEL